MDDDHWLTQGVPLHEGVAYADTAEGTVAVTTRVVQVGSVSVPSGSLAIGDIGWCPLPAGAVARVTVPPGRYVVWATDYTYTDPSGTQWEYTTAASVRLCDDVPASRERLRTVEGVRSEGRLDGVGVDGGMCSFVDASALDTELQAEETWEHYVFDVLPERPMPWVETMPGGGDLVGVTSGAGDGDYPAYGDYTADGKLVAVHVDFLMARRDEYDDIEKDFS